jgi:hypothetical protein
MSSNLGSPGNRTDWLPSKLASAGVQRAFDADTEEALAIWKRWVSGRPIHKLPSGTHLIRHHKGNTLETEVLS